jgi:hypothetical protein
MRTEGKQHYPNSEVGGNRPETDACMARLYVAEAPLDGGRGLMMAAVPLGVAAPQLKN